MRKIHVSSLVHDQKLATKLESLLKLFVRPIVHWDFQSLDELKKNIDLIDLFIFYEHDLSLKEFKEISQIKNIHILILTHDKKSSPYKDFAKELSIDPFVEAPFSAYFIAAKMGHFIDNMMS